MGRRDDARGGGVGGRRATADTGRGGKGGGVTKEGVGVGGGGGGGGSPMAVHYRYSALLAQPDRAIAF